MPVRLLDTVHIDQIALVAAEKAGVAELPLDFIQTLVDHVGIPASAVKNAFRVAAFHIQNFVERNSDHF